MRCGNWGKEPFDLRLTLLRLVRCLPWILSIILVGTLVFGSGYYLRKVVLRTEKSYGAEATFLVEYKDTDWAVYLRYINENSWNLWMQSDLFQSFVIKHLEEVGAKAPEEDLGEILKVTVPSDLRMAQLTVLSDDPEKADHLLAAVKLAMTEDFPEVMEDVALIKVTDTQQATEILPDVRPLRAVLLAAVLSTFFALLFFLVRELTQERIWLPASLKNLYGLHDPGIPGSDEYAMNLQYLFRGKTNVGVILTRGKSKSDSLPEEFKSFTEALTEAMGPGHRVQLQACCPIGDAEKLAELRSLDGVLLVVNSGEDAKYLEYVLSFLAEQEVEVTAAVLWKEDRWLLRTYYGLGKRI